MRRVAVCLTIGLLSSAAAAIVLEDGTFLFDAATPVPPAVMALQDCETADCAGATGWKVLVGR